MIVDADSPLLSTGKPYCEEGAKFRYQGQLCVRGHTGPMCQVCKEGWIFNELAQHCECCSHYLDCPNPDGDDPTLAIVLILAGGVAVAVIVKKGFRKAASVIVAVFPWITALQKKIAKQSVKAKIMLTYFQIISQYMGSIINDAWPPV